MGALARLRRRLAPAAAAICLASASAAPCLTAAFLSAAVLVPPPIHAQALAVRWHADAALEGVASALAADAWIFSALPGVGELGSTLSDTVDIWLLSEFRSHDGLPEMEPEPWVAGIALPQLDVIVLRAESGRGGLTSLRQVLRHELAHLALARATAGNAPIWLQEGYAQFAAGAWGASEAWRLQVAFMHGDASLHALALRFPRQREAASLAYLLSYTAVTELYGLSGEAGLRGVFGRLAEGADLDAALRDVYGLTEAQFEERWRRRVAGRYGWLYVLSRASLFWLALTIALVVFGWRRRRYNRLRWQALRQAEAAELQEAMEIAETIEAFERRRAPDEHR